MADVVAHRAEHPEGRHPHDDVRVLEHRLRHALEEREHRLAPLSGAHQRHAEERREDDDREDVPLGRVLHEVRRQRVKGDVPAALRLRHRHRRVDAEVEREVVARAERIDDDEADDQRQRRDRLEVEQRLAAHAPDGLEVPGLGDADDDRREEERDDEPLDEPYERLREERHRVVRERVRVLRENAAEDDAEREAGEDEGGAGGLSHAAGGRGEILTVGAGTDAFARVGPVPPGGALLYETAERSANWLASVATTAMISPGSIGFEAYMSKPAPSARVRSSTRA